MVLGLLAAVTYGAADFMGGLMTRRVNVFAVVVVSQMFGSLVILAVLPFFLDAQLTSAALVWGSLSGLAGGAGVAFFYQGLSVGRMSVIAPVTGVEAASLPVIFGLLMGERPGTLPLTGVALALVAVALVSSAPGDVEEEGGAVLEALSLWANLRRSGLLHAGAAGLGFGLFFIFLSEAGENTGMWPLVAARVASVGVVALAAWGARRSIRAGRSALPGIALTGGLDVAANILYLLASRQGLLSLVAVLTSMYPASTVVLARFVGRERLFRTQLIGLGVAAIGVSLIAAS